MLLLPPLLRHLFFLRGRLHAYGVSTWPISLQEFQQHLRSRSGGDPLMIQLQASNVTGNAGITKLLETSF